METRVYSVLPCSDWEVEGGCCAAATTLDAPGHVCSACVSYPFPTFQPWKICTCWEIPHENYCSGWKKKKNCSSVSQKTFLRKLGTAGSIYFLLFLFLSYLIQNPLGPSPLSWLSSEYRPETWQHDVFLALHLYFVYFRNLQDKIPVFSQMHLRAYITPP